MASCAFFGVALGYGLSYSLCMNVNKFSPIDRSNAVFSNSMGLVARTAMVFAGLLLRLLP